MIDRTTPGVILYTGLDQPDVEVRDPDDPETWHEGELRMWRRDDEGAWWADVQWRRGPGQGNFVGTFAEADVRPDLSDPRNAPQTSRICTCHRPSPHPVAGRNICGLCQLEIR